MEDVRVSFHSTSADRQHTDGKVMGVSSDTSLYIYTRLKFIPRSFQKCDWSKQNASINSLQFFLHCRLPRTQPSWNVIQMFFELNILFCFAMERRPFADLVRLMAFQQSIDNARQNRMLLKNLGDYYCNAGSLSKERKVLSCDYSLGCEWHSIQKILKALNF